MTIIKWMSVSLSGFSRASGLYLGSKEFLSNLPEQEVQILGHIVNEVFRQHAELFGSFRQRKTIVSMAVARLTL